MQNFQDIFETCKRSLIRVFSICMTVPLKVAAFVIFSTFIMVLFEIHQRFKGHFLNKLRVAFKDTLKALDDFKSKQQKCMK